MTLESSDVTATRRLRESGVTDYEESVPGGHKRLGAHRIGIHHEDILVKGWIDTDDISHLVVDLEL